MTVEGEGREVVVDGIGGGGAIGGGGKVVCGFKADFGVVINVEFSAPETRAVVK